MAETTQAVQAKPKRGMSKSLRDSLVAYSFIAPNFIGFCIFTLVPMIFAIGLSFCNWDGVHPVEFTGISNFVALLSDKTFKAAFVNTLVYAIGTVPLTLVCSLGLAMLLNQKVKFRNFFRTVSFFPYVASLVAVAAVWNMIFSPSMGPVNQILATLGVENLPKWAAGKDTAMLTVILFSVWKNMGYYMVIYLAGLQGTNPELEEAAELDGASKWQIFWNVTLPQLKPTTFFVIIMMTIASFKVYDQMYMITQGGPGNATMTLVYYIYNVAFVNTPKYGYASAVSMVLFVLVFHWGIAGAAASIDLKADEAGLLAFCRAHGWPITFYSAEQVRALSGPFTPSPFVQSVTGVDNVCERAAVLTSGGCIRIPKQAGGGVTFALALCPYAPDWRWQNG